MESENKWSTSTLSKFTLDEQNDANTLWVCLAYFRKSVNLTLSWRRALYRNQSIDLLRKSMDRFLYDNGLSHERVNFHEKLKNLILNGNSKRELKQNCKIKRVWYTFKASSIFIFKQRYLCKHDKDLSTTNVIYVEPVASTALQWIWLFTCAISWRCNKKIPIHLLICFNLTWIRRLISNPVEHLWWSLFAKIING